MTNDDEDKVPDEAVLWRRVHPSQVVEGTRASSAAFDPHPDDGLTSICMASVAETTDEMMVGHEGFWLLEFTAGDARRCGFEIEPDSRNVPYAGHTNLKFEGSKSARKRAQKQLASSPEVRWKIRGKSSP